MALATRPDVTRVRQEDGVLESTGSAREFVANQRLHGEGGVATSVHSFNRNTTESGMM